MLRSLDYDKLEQQYQALVQCTDELHDDENLAESALDPLPCSTSDPATNSTGRPSPTPTLGGGVGSP